MVTDHLNKSQAFFLSDLHLRKECPEDIQKLEVFIDQLIEAQSTAHLYFLGDVFDFWVGEFSPVKTACTPFLEKLRVYNEHHGPVVFFEGNHDIHLDPLFKTQWGFEVVSQYKKISLGQKQILLEHGDLFDPEDTGYMTLRAILRHPMTRFFALYVLPQPLIFFIGRCMSFLNSRLSKTVTSTKIQNVRDKFLEYAQKELKAYQASTFIAGHIHQRFHVTLKDEIQSSQSHKNLEIINLGSWFQKKTVLCFDGVSFEFFEL